MQLYKNFFKMIRGHRVSITIYLIVMIIYAISMIYSAPYTVDRNEQSSTEMEVNYSSIGVILRDHDHSELSEGLKTYLEKFTDVETDDTSSEERINDIMYFHLSDYFIEIPENFQEKIEAGEEVSLTYSSNNQISGKTFSFVNDIDAFVNLFRSYRAMGLSSEESVSRALNTSESDVTFGIVAEEKEVKHGDAKSYALYMILQFFNFTCLCLMCTGVGAVIIESNKKAVSDRITCAPVRLSTRNLANFAGLLTCAGVIVLATILFAIIYGRNTEIISKYAWVVVLNLITTTFYICALTLLVCSFNPKTSSLNLISNSVGLSMCFLCGIYVPLNVLSSSIQTIAHFLPFFWSSKIMNTVYSDSGMGYHFSVGSIFSSLGVQILFGVAFLLLSMIVRKMRRVEA